jgi:hypothetical protein
MKQKDLFDRTEQRYMTKAIAEKIHPEILGGDRHSSNNFVSR